jgi:hypothetical protein
MWPDGTDSLDWLRALMDYPQLVVVIFSTRNHQPGGQVAIMEWLEHWGLEVPYLQRLELVTEKPPAWVTVDDRVIKFDPKKPEELSPEAIVNFLAWHQQEV